MDHFRRHREGRGRFVRIKFVESAPFGPKPKEEVKVSEEELSKLIGDLVDSWLAVERELFGLFNTLLCHIGSTPAKPGEFTNLTMRISPRECHAIFSVRGLKEQVELTANLAKVIVKNPDLSNRMKKAVKRINTGSEKRNKIVHGS